MRKQFTETVDFETLIRYMEGTADKLSAEQVEIWIASGEENKRLFNRLNELWSHPEDLASLNAQTIEADWAKLLDRIHRNRTVHPSRPFVFLKRWKPWLQIAAVFFAVLAVAGITYRLTTRPVGNQEGLVYNEIRVPNGQKSELVLSDGTKIVVNGGSKVRFPDQFDRNNRELWLDGQAYFEVSRNPAKPFFVYTGDLTIKVLGTAFDVEAYSTDGFVKTTLVNGQVKLWKNGENEGSPDAVMLEPNRQAVLVRDLQALRNESIRKCLSGAPVTDKIVVSESFNVETNVSWTDGRLSFENEPFEIIAKKLERRFGVEIVIQDADLKQIRFTGILKNISVEQAMKALQMTTPFKITILNETLYIHH